jgi:ribonuclease D
MPLITKQNQLEEICDLIAKKKIAAIDTEFIREKTYLPILCLIQINVAEKCYLIDTLSGLDLLPFFKILNDPKIIKIFHSARQDVEILLLSCPKKITKKFFPQSVFDTQIMAALCGMGYTISYSNLAKTLLEKDVAKDWQRSDWQKRPLHKEQVEYAKIDVLYLPEIYKLLKAKLKKQKKLDWAFEEMKLNVQKAIIDTDLCKKFSFVNKSSSYQENVMLLTKWRDDKARKHNIPRGFVFNDESLDKIASKSQFNSEFLQTYTFKTRISRSEIKLEITDLFKTKIHLTDAIPEKPRIPTKLNEQQKALYQKSKELLQTQAEIHQVNQELIINQAGLQQLIFSQKPIIQSLFGWRYLVIGKELEELIGCKLDEK